MPFSCKIMKTDGLTLINGNKQLGKVTDMNRLDSEVR